MTNLSPMAITRIGIFQQYHFPRCRIIAGIKKVEASPAGDVAAIPFNRVMASFRASVNQGHGLVEKVTLAGHRSIDAGVARRLFLAVA